jgi:hypothetical protein
MLVILKFGRTGNAILQIIKCISENINHYRCRKINLQHLKNHSILKYFPSEFEFPEYDGDVRVEDTFWDTKHETTDEQIKFIVETYIKPYINYEIDGTPIQWDTDLVVHIRSGDVFASNFPLEHYIQPPFSFYEKIICENRYRHVFLVSENRENPVIAKLLDTFPNTTFLSNDFEIDFKILLRAESFVYYNKTFYIVVK